MISTKIGKYEELFKLAYSIRKVVFVNEQGVTYDTEFDPFDPEATHIVLFDNEKPIATGRLIFKNSEWQIGRVAVLSEYRGQGLGARVMKELLEYAEAQGIKKIHVHSQCHAQKFYEKLGFEAYGDIYLEADGIEHTSMIWASNA